ncbi:MAG: 1-deoxy-D-xylulose-5-phosphate synthase [Sphingobacteriia bacterium]|nr:1-deoxy-D-xylulose-5-phosphate synthase [Sphingobacteriia bacterium]
MKYPILDNINYPKDLKGLSIDELKALAEELRQKTIEVVSQTGGHLGAGLGVIELTIALHYVFETPFDKVIWDIGHQTYPHKILTGRKDKMLTLRKKGGLSGFTRRLESEYDHFGAGHSSTSVSAALGMVVARDLKQEDKHVVAVIGDGAISAGMAYEAFNNAGYSKNKLIVILNNNDMSIAPPTGAMSKYLSKISSSKPYLTFRNFAKQALEFLPSGVENFVKKTEQYFRNISTVNDIFDDLGFYSIGPLNGHDLEDLITVLTNIKEDKNVSSPFLVHIITEKGKGFTSSQGSIEKYHAVNIFDLETGEQKKSANSKLTYTNIFAESLVKIAKEDDKIIAITAAMPSGTGLDSFAKHFPDRMFDVGIAEQHAVTFAAGLACEGLKPFCTLYSTFLQRAYDQVVHDVALQNLPVRFAIDRAGLVGADGPTHAGSFDLTYLCSLPNFVVMAPSDAYELASAVKTAAYYNFGPIAFRYPRGESNLLSLDKNEEMFTIGKGRIIKLTENMEDSIKVGFISLGTLLENVIQASQELEQEYGVMCSIADARFAKPIDKDLIRKLANSHDVLITLEEGAIGGFSAQVLELLSNEGYFDQGKLIYRALYLPDKFIEQATQAEMLMEAKLDKGGIVSQVLNITSKIYKREMV